MIHCKLPPPLTQPPVFADAAEARPGQFRLGVFRAGSFASSVPAAPGISTINAAELSALLHGLSQSAKRRFTFISLLGDNAAAFFTLLRARCSFRLPSQTRTLFLIWKLVNRCSGSRSVSSRPPQMLRIPSLAFIPCRFLLLFTTLSSALALSRAHPQTLVIPFGYGGDSSPCSAGKL